MDFKISVIIPCRNVEKWIDRCLLSLKNQTIGFENLQVILINDASTDATFERLSAFEKENSENVIVLDLKENVRQGAARNLGLEYATAKWIAFIDSDDFVDSRYLDIMYEKATGADYDFVSVEMLRDPSLVPPTETPLNIEGTEYLIENDSQLKESVLHPKITFSACAKLIRKDFLLKNELFFLEGVAYEDTLWGSLLNLCAKKAYFFNLPLYHYFVNEESTVIRKNADYHYDLIEVQENAFLQYKARGYLEKLQMELQIEFIYSAFLAGLKIAVLRFDNGYDYYVALRKMVLKYIPDWENNAYVKGGFFSEKHAMMLSLLRVSCSCDEFEKFAALAKKIGF